MMAEIQNWAAVSKKIPKNRFKSIEKRPLVKALQPFQIWMVTFIIGMI